MPSVDVGVVDNNVVACGQRFLQSLEKDFVDFVRLALIAGIAPQLLAYRVGIVAFVTAPDQLLGERRFARSRNTNQNY